MVQQYADVMTFVYIDTHVTTIHRSRAAGNLTLNEIKDFEQKGNNWLEPMKEMILASSQAKILLSQSDNQEIRAFLKNIGSNFILKDKKFQFALKIGWRALAEGEPTKTFSNWRREGDSNPR